MDMTRKIFCSFTIVAAALLGPGTASAQTAQKTIQLKAGTESPEGTTFYETLHWLATEMDKRTNGRIKVTLYPNSALGTETDMVSAARNGSIDFVIIGAGNFASFVPELEFLSVPYLFPDREAYLKAMDQDSKVWKLIQKYTAQRKLGVSVVAPTTIGSRWVANAKGPIHNLQEFRDAHLKMRVQANPLEAQIWSNYGAIPVNMPMPDVYTAAKQGIVTAAENSPSILYNYNVYEVMPYLTKTEHSFYVALVVMSDKTLTKIPDDLKDVFAKTIRDSGVHALEVGQAFTDEAVENMKKKGATIISDVDKESFIKPVEPLQEQVAQKVGATDLLKAVRELGGNH